MLDSGSKPPENRIHLYDPVGLITDGYGSFRPSSYTVRPRRQTVSYDNFVETTHSNNSLELRSYDSFADANSTGGLRSYDSFEVDSLSLRSYNDTLNSETNGGRISSYDSMNSTMTEDRNDGGLRFIVVDKVIEDDQSDDSTPRLWRPSSPTSPKSVRSPLHHSASSTPNSAVKSSVLHPSSPKSSVNTSVLHPTSPKFVVNSPPPLHHPTSPKSVNFSPLHHPTSPKSVTPLNNNNILNSSNQNQYQTMSPNSRTQAIAKGRRELMDMVRDLPETFYELSLKDIVEQKPAADTEMKKEVNIPEEKKIIKETTKLSKETKKQKKSSKKVKKSESKKKMVRSRSVDNGKFLLKTSVFPILGSRKSKKSLTAVSSFKVAPMPKTEPTTSTRPVKAGEKDWWRRRSCILSESDDGNDLSSQSTSSSSSSSSSSRSNSSNGRRNIKFLTSCCLFNGRRIGGKK